MPQPQMSKGDALSLLLSLLGLAGSDSAKAKAIAATRLAGTGARLAGAPRAAGGLGLAAGAAGLGLTLADLAKSNLSTRDKVGEGVGGAFDLGASYAIPYYGTSKLVAGVGSQLAKSRSPQVAGAGRAIKQTGEPVGARIFARGIRGHGPWEDMDTKSANEGFILDMLGPLGAIAAGLGKGQKVAEGVSNFGPVPFGGKALDMLRHEPTHGTKFRRSMEMVFKKIPGFETFEGGASRNYEMTPELLKKLDQRDVGAATQLAKMIAPVGQDFDRDSQGYTDQVRNMLLNLYGHPGELTSKLEGALAFLMKRQ